MRISRQLALAFSGTGLLLCGSALFALQEVQESLEQAVHAKLLGIADRSLARIEAALTAEAEQMQAYATAAELWRVADAGAGRHGPEPHSAIAEADAAWRAGGEPATLAAALGHPQAGALRRFVEAAGEGGMGAWAEMYITDRYGSVVAASNRTSDYLQADEDWYQEAVSDPAPWIGPLEYDASSAALSLDLVIDLHRPDGVFAGIFKGVLGVSRLEALLQEGLEDSGYRSLRLYLVDGAGRRVVGDRDRVSAREDLPLAAFGSELAHWPALYRATGGRRATALLPGRLAALAPVDRRQGTLPYWSVVAELDTAEAFAPIDESRRRLVLGFGLAGLLVVVTGTLLTRSVSRRLARLTAAARRIGKGRLDTRVPMGDQDEIGELAEAINHMAGELQVAMVSKGYVDSILGSMSDLLLLLARDGRIRVVNPAACELLGYCADELVGQPMSAICREPFLDDPALASLVLAGSVSTLERTCISRGGLAIPVLFSVSLLRGDASELEGVVLVGLDIGRRLQSPADATGTAEAVA